MTESEKSLSQKSSSNLEFATSALRQLRVAIDLERDYHQYLYLTHNQGYEASKFDSEALEKLHRAAETGNVAAQSELGHIYMQGLGVPADDAEAVKWYQRAAEQSNADSQNTLGLMYQNGRGVPQDSAEAVKWYRRAAEQNHAAGQYNLPGM